MKSPRERIPKEKPITYDCYVCGRSWDFRTNYCHFCHSFDAIIPSNERVEGGSKKNLARPAAELSMHPPRFHSTESPAWDHVLGGGFVRKSTSLIFGPRGVGKSTRTLAVAARTARRMGGLCLYGSAEMPGTFVRLYADRVGLTKEELACLWVQDSNACEDMVREIKRLKPCVIVWDSVQRFQWEGEVGELELRKVVQTALDVGSAHHAVTLLISQVTKDEVFFGPNTIGHDVDVLIELSRDEKTNEVVIACTEKNRFAETPREAREALTAEARPSSERPPETPKGRAPLARTDRGDDGLTIDGDDRVRAFLADRTTGADQGAADEASLSSVYLGPFRP